MQNTLITLSDNKIGTDTNTDNLADFYTASVLSATDYYAFGMSMKERSWQSESYRYGFNGKEKDKDIGEEIEDFDNRLLNKKIGRWFSPDRDAHHYPSQSSYSFSLNNPILFVDPDGNSPKPSEFIAKQLGVKLSPMTAGFIDGALNGIGILAMGKLAYDLGTDEGFRSEFFESIKAIATDPVGFMKSVVDDHVENIKNIASWNEKGQYAVGEFVGEKLTGIISGGAVAWLMKYTKKFTSSKVEIKKPTDVGKAPSKNKNVECACFLAGTIVKTKAGDKPIEQVKEGDYLLAQDEVTGKLSYKKVLKKHIIFEKEKIYHLYIGKEVIKVTGKHPFRIGSKWIEVQFLHVGDSVSLATGNRMVIDSIAVINGAYTVYNFTVEDFHTYYVSKTGVLVHNCPDDKPPVEIKISKSKYPETATHIEEAINNGHPDTGKIDRKNASNNRKEALSGIETESGKDRDEFPPAILDTGGKGASVKLIKPSDNRGAGGSMGGQMKKLSNGTEVKIVVTD